MNRFLSYLSSSTQGTATMTASSSSLRTSPDDAHIDKTTCSNNINEQLETQSKPKEPPKGPPLKILFLSSDTGGGHRASAESLAQQFLHLHPGSTYHIHDPIKSHSYPPLSSLESWYAHLSSHPKQWDLIYRVSNNKTVEGLLHVQMRLTTERAIRETIRELDVDVVISVHPMMNTIPSTSCHILSSETGRHLPFYTVVTDLGSGHGTWFEPRVENVFVASEELRRVAVEKGGVGVEKLVMSGLPIRRDFGLEVERMGDGGRNGVSGMVYQRMVRRKLGILMDDDDDGVDVCNNNVILVMGGGEGVGSLSSIVDSLYIELRRYEISATILVICGRNNKLKKSLEDRDWKDLFRKAMDKEECDRRRDRFRGRSRDDKKSLACHVLSRVWMTQDRAKEMDVRMKEITNTTKHNDENDNDDDNHQESFSGMDQVCNNATGGGGDSASLMEERTSSSISTSSKGSSINPDTDEMSDAEDDLNNLRNFPMATKQKHTETTATATATTVQPLGFVQNMAEYMVAADMLVTKAGPGTIAEAASVGLPVLLTSFLPGQEEGNVDFVVDNKFGTYRSDSHPKGVAREVCRWIKDRGLLEEMSERAREVGVPDAAESIARRIGTSVVRWKEVHGEEWS